jgi:hypothetical protein
MVRFNWVKSTFHKVETYLVLIEEEEQIRELVFEDDLLISMDGVSTTEDGFQAPLKICMQVWKDNHWKWERKVEYVGKLAKDTG